MTQHSLAQDLVGALRRVLERQGVVLLESRYELIARELQTRFVFDTGRIHPRESSPDDLQNTAADAAHPSEQTTPSPWVRCSERNPEDFERVLVYFRDLGTFVGSRFAGQWRVDTPAYSPSGKKILLTDLPDPERWMPIPPNF